MKLSYFPSFCLYVALIIFLPACKKENVKTIKPVEIAPVKTNPATIYTDGGVTLNGTINKIPANLVEYGFFLSTDSTFRSVQPIKVSTPAAVGAFKADINTGLLKNTIYYCKAYNTVSDGSGLVTYNVVAFNSSGSKKIVTTSVAPLKADLDDTITIKGKYFTNQPGLAVKFGNQYSTIRLLSDSVIKCTVPINLDQQAPLIIVQDSFSADTATTKFSLNTPVISSFTSIATFRDTVVITGDHFGYQNSLNQVSFGNVAVPVLSSNRKQIKVLVPDNIANSFTTLTVKAQLQTAISSAQFQVRPPVITSVTASGNVNDPVTVNGKYFHPVLSYNNIYSESNQAQLTGGSISRLTYNIPNGPYPRRKATVKLKLLDYTITYTTDMVIKDKWIVVGTVPFNDYAAPGAITINNVSYIVASTRDYLNQRQYLWKFNPADFSWQQIDISVNFTNGKIIAAGNKAYLYIINSTNAHNFYEFDPAGNTWTAKADYPAAVRAYATMFSIGDKVYYGLGSSSTTFGNPDTDDSFYEYNTATDSWRRVADYPDPPSYGLRNLASAFVINNVAYVGCGATNSGMTKFFAYSQATNSWAAVSDFPEVRSYTTSFAFGNNGYIATGESFAGTPAHDNFRYSPASNTWTHLADYVGCNVCSWGTERGFTFINNGNVYLGGGNSSSSAFYLLQAVGSRL